MALVDYDSSEDEEPVDSQTEPITSTKRKRENDSSSDLPPLPSKFHDLYASTTRLSTTDDPSLHGGRKRVTPHVEGNWPTHLYLEWCPATTEYEILTKLITTLKDGIPKDDYQIHSFLTSGLGAPLPLHVSLSRSVGFTAEKKDNFLTTLERGIRTSGIRPFDIGLSGLNWVSNFEKTRWFLILRLKAPIGNGLNKLLHVCNGTIQQYGQPPLYTPATNQSRKIESSSNNSRPQGRRGSEVKVDWSGMHDRSEAFHISIAWTLKPPNQKLIEITRAIASERLEAIQGISVEVKDLKSKIGNIATSIPLHKSVAESTSMFSF